MAVRTFRFHLLIVALTVLWAASVAFAAPVHKHPKPYVKGTTQMAGGAAKFGQTYTYVDNGSLVNMTIVKAEYSTGRLNIQAGMTLHGDNQHKLLIIHYRIKNANKGDMYYGSGHMFQAVDSNGNTIDDSGYSRRESEKARVGTEIKPGQGIDDLETAVVAPLQGPITKLIYRCGRAGTADKVTRFDLGTAPNVAAPLAAPYVDPSDKSHDSGLALIDATVGTTYMAGYHDISLDSVSLAPSPLAGQDAGNGNQFLVAKVTITNKTWTQIYFNGNISPTLKTDDDKITNHQNLKGDHDEGFQGRTMDPDDTATERIIIPVPKDATLKTLTLVNDMGDDGLSSAFVYDVSGVK